MLNVKGFDFMSAVNIVNIVLLIVIDPNVETSSFRKFYQLSSLYSSNKYEYFIGSDLTWRTSCVNSLDIIVHDAT